MNTNDGAGYLKVYRTPLGQRMSAFGGKADTEEFCLNFS